MIRIGIAGIPHHTKGQGTEAGVRYLCSIGLNAMEVQFARNVYMTPRSASECASVGNECGLDFSIHAPYYINLTSKNQATQEKSKDWILKSARIGSSLGAKVIVFHSAREQDPDLVVSHLKEVVATLKDEGISIPLGLETMGDLGEFGGLEDICYVVDKVPGTDIVLDFAHIHSRGNGCLKSKQDFEAVFDSIRHIKKDDFHIHFAGIEYKNSREVRHLPLGDPDFSMLAGVLVERGYNARIICESPLLEEDALKMRSIVDRLQGQQAMP